MSEPDYHRFLASAVDDVLETMFFSEVLGPCDPDPSAAGLEAHVSFSGSQSGAVAVRISVAAARCLAASFLGESEDSLTETQVAQVVCELANMLCGCMVTRMASQGTFSLSSPELFGEPDHELINGVDVHRSFAIEHGTITVSLTSCEFV